MRAELIELHQRIGRTMVYVTHDQLEAMTMSDRIAVMRDGVLQQYAPPGEVYNRPANRFVAGFIGTPAMNFLDGELTLAGEASTFRAGSLTLDLPDQFRGAAAASDAPHAVALGARPEDVLLGADGWPAQVRVVEPTGHESIVVVEVAGARLVARVPADVAVRPGEPVRVTLRAARLHLFDRATGLRLAAAR